MLRLSGVCAALSVALALAGPAAAQSTDAIEGELVLITPVAKTLTDPSLAAGFAVPSYMAFEDRLAGFDIKFVAPKTAWITPERLFCTC